MGSPDSRYASSNDAPAKQSSPRSPTPGTAAKSLLRSVVSVQLLFDRFVLL